MKTVVFIHGMFMTPLCWEQWITYFQGRGYACTAPFPMINPLISKYRPRLMSFEDFQYAFVNTLPLEEQRAAYDRYVVPESRQVPGQSITRIGRVDFKKPHAPLLLIAGSDDHIIPASLNKTNYAKYRVRLPLPTTRNFPVECILPSGRRIGSMWLITSSRG